MWDKCKHEEYHIFEFVYKGTDRTPMKTFVRTALYNDLDFFHKHKKKYIDTIPMMFKKCSLICANPVLSILCHSNRYGDKERHEYRQNLLLNKSFWKTKNSFILSRV